MDKPLPVKIVESVWRVLVALSVLAFIASIALALRGDIRRFGWEHVLFFSFPIALTVGMFLLLRQGRRALFLVTYLIVISFPVAALGLILPDAEIAKQLALAAALLSVFAAPIVLLCLPASKRWFRERLGGKPEPKGSLVCLIAILVLLNLTVIPEITICAGHARAWQDSAAMMFRARDLAESMALNNTRHGTGEDWVDPAACTNSTQFVQALCEKYKGDIGKRSRDLGSYANIWCIAVNPPDDESFPRVFTCNIDPRELLSQTDVNRLLTLTCPKSWGGKCFRFCEKGAVIARVGGATGIVKSKYARLRLIFPKGVPKPASDTYFLTPTGRVDFVAHPLDSGGHGSETSAAE